MSRGKKIRFALILIAVSLILEIFVFNINSFHLIGGGYEESELDLTGYATDNGGSGSLTFEFLDLYEPVGTVTCSVSSDTNASVTVQIDASDDSNAAYRTNIASGTVIAGNERSRTIVCNFSGNVHDLRITFAGGTDETVTVEEIAINRPVTFRFSVLRFFLMLIAGACVYLFLFSKLASVPVCGNERIAYTAAYIVTAVFLTLAVLITMISKSSSNITHSFFSVTGNQLTKELVDAFEARSVSLLEEPSKELLALSNPYDWSARIEAGCSYLWDHLLYDGKYYSYYGIAPVLLLFLPYHLITGYYFPSAVAVCLFGCIGIFFLTRFYLCLVRKFFPNIKASVMLAGLVQMQLVTGVWFCFNVPNFYEIAQTSGFACVTAGAYFLIASNVVGSGKICRIRLALATTFLSLGVLCRPTLVAYCIAALVFVYAGFRKMRMQQENRPVSYFLSGLLPFFLIGSVQMAYNYLRFGSVFDFGIQYSLTINDFTSSQYHTHFVLIGFFNYLFAFPKFSENFPFFLASTVETFLPNGYYFVATKTAVGLCWKSLPVFSYAYGKKAYRLSGDPQKKYYPPLIISACILAPCVIIFSIWESGYGARYAVDFAWQILCGALVIAFTVFLRCSAQIQKHLNRLLFLTTVLCFILCFAQIYQWIDQVTGLNVWEKANYLSFGRLFEFWR